MKPSRALLTTLVEVVGMGFLTAAAWIVALPAGLAVAGAALVLIGALSGRGGPE